MKSRDYFRLARLSLRSKRKTTIQTVIGISFGLILLLPSLFIAIAFYGGFNIQMNKQASYRAFNITYADTITNENSVVYNCYQGYQEKIDELSGIKKELKYDFVVMDMKGRPYVMLDNKEISLTAKHPNYGNYPGFGMNIINKEQAHDPFLVSDYSQAPFPLVYGTTFSEGDNSKGEIMVSYNFLKDYKLLIGDVIGKTISLYSYTTSTGNTLGISSSESEYILPPEYEEGGYVPYFVNYKVVGIYSAAINKESSIRNKNFIPFASASSSYRYTTNYQEYFWITSASLNESSAPKYCEQSQTADNNNRFNGWYYYSSTPLTLATSVTNEGYTFLPYALGAYSRNIINPHYSGSQFVEFTSFNAARNAYEKIKEYYNQSSENTKNPPVSFNISMSGFSQYLAFYDVFLYVCLGLAALGGVIFVATILNLLNTLHFSVQSMRGFLGICRAQGMHDRGVIRLFLDQFNIIFMRAYIAAILVGGFICIELKLIFDRSLAKTIKADTGLTMTLEWWYIPIALAVMIVTTTLLSYLFSYLLAGKTSKTPILDILSEETK